MSFNDESEILHLEVFIQGEEKYSVLSAEDALFILGAHQEGEQLLVALKSGYKRWEDVVETKTEVDIDMGVVRSHKGQKNTVYRRLKHRQNSGYRL